jgi:hypothetical protein
MSLFAGTGINFSSQLGLILQSPIALIALALVPLIVLLHMLNVKWKEVEVSSLVFWDAVAREKRASLRLRSILRNLILLLQLLVAGLLAFALSQPLLSRMSLSGRGNVILVLDTTASMSAREGGRTRLDEAKSRATALLPTLRRGAGMCVITAGRSPALIVPFTEDRDRLRRAIAGVRPTDEAGDMRDAILLAISLRDPKRDDRVVVITDGAFDSLGGPQSGPARGPDTAAAGEPSALADLDEGASWMSLIRVGENGANAGITALSLRKSSGPEGDYEMFVDVRNFSTSPMSFPLTVTAGTKKLYGTSVALAAGEERGFSTPVDVSALGIAEAAGAAQTDAAGAAQAGASRITAEIGTADGLSADNYAYAVLEPARRIRALIVGPGNFFLRTALLSLPNVSATSLDSTESAESPVGVSEGTDVVVFDGVVPPALDRGNYILIGAIPPGLPLEAVGILDNPRVTSWNRAHPLMKSVSMDLSISQAFDVEAKGFTGLLFSGAKPLMLAYERPGLKVLFIGFRLEGSDLPLKPAFPLFLANALEWFSPGWLSVQAESLRTGEEKEIPVEPAAAPGESSSNGDPVIVQRPDGVREVLPAGRSSLSYRDTGIAGFYTVSEGGVKILEFASSLTDSWESRIEPRFGFSGGRAEVGADGTEAAGTSFTPIWITLAVTAAALILAEWLLAVREKR